MMVDRICEKCGKHFTAGPTAKLCDICKDVTGQKIGMWTVLEKAQNRGIRDYFLCRCECGTIKEVSGDNLRSGKTGNCGCLNKEMLRKRHQENAEDITGKKYGELKVLEFAGFENNERMWKCQCACGKIVYKSTYTLNSGRTNSCGHLVPEKAAQIADCGTNPAAIMSEKLSARNKSGVKGVYFDKNRGKWSADIMFRGKKYRLGRYEKLEDAKKVRKLAEDRLHGGFLEWYAETYPEKWAHLQKTRSKKTNTTIEIPDGDLLQEESD